MEDDLTPLSNDPESLTDFAVSIGLNESSFQFMEVFSFDDEILDMIPKPVLSTIFLFPIGDKDGVLEKRHSEEKDLAGLAPLPWFTHQTVPNSCGTVAVIHSVLNNLSCLNIDEESWLTKFIPAAANESPDERAKRIEESEELLDIHEDNAEEDSTPLLEDSGWNHFIAFVIVGGKLWELDGRKPVSICHGECQDALAGSLEVLRRDFFPHIADLMKVSLCAFCGK
jgi:ubiquitin carboxyl-terminal hydrolase L3